MQVMKGILYELILKLRFCNFHSSKKLSANLIKSGSSAPKEHVRSSKANHVEPHTKWLCKPWLLNHFVLSCCQILQKVQNDKDDDRPQVGIRLVYGLSWRSPVLGIRLVYGKFSFWYTVGIRGCPFWYTCWLLYIQLGIRALSGSVYARYTLVYGVSVFPVYGKYTLVYGDPLLHVGLTPKTDNMQTLLLLTSPDMWKSKRSLAEDPLQFKCSGWPAPKKNATVLNHFLAEDPLQSYKKLTGSNKWDNKWEKNSQIF